MDELIRKIRVAPSATAAEAMQAVDRGAVEIALVIDYDGHLLGTVTDGDLRRVLLRGDSLEMPVTQAMNQHPRTAPASSSGEQLLDIMRLKGINQLPLLDTQGRVAGLALLEALVRSARRENSAVIMAGGLGNRLRPLTVDVPKPLLRVGDRPILETIILQLRRHGISRIMLSINYHSDQIRNYFQDGSHLGVRIHYLEEDEPLGTAGSLRLAQPYLKGPFLVMNGDLLTQLNFANLLDYHLHKKNMITVCLRQHEVQIPYGICNLDDDQLTGIEEKPEIKVFVNGGIYVIDPAMLALLPAAGRFDMTDLVNRAVEHDHTVGRFIINEYWLDIGQLQDYERANREYRQHFGEPQE